METAAEEPIATVKILKLPEGTYKITVTESVPSAPLGEDFTGTALQVSTAPVLSEGFLEISSGPGTFERWLRGREDFLIARIRGGSAALMLTSIRAENSAAMAIDIRRLEEEVPIPSDIVAAGLSSDDASARLLPTVVVAHIQGAGDMKFSGEAITGPARTWIEGFEIQHTDSHAPNVAEYCAVRSDGVVTPWLDAGRFCGSRNAQVALIGFALRIKPEFEHEYECVYGGQFASGRLCESLHDGAMCQSIFADDPLVSMEIRIFAH